MKNIQNYLTEDIGKIPTYEETSIGPDVENALDVIADFLKSNNSNDKREIRLIVTNMLSILDDKFTGKYTQLGELFFDSIKKYYQN